MIGVAGHSDAGGDDCSGAGQDISAIAVRIFSACEIAPVDVGVGEEDQELFAAVAGGEVAGTQRRPQGGTHIGQDLVADGMAEAVVDVLEVVEIEAEQRERGSVRDACATIRLRVSPAARLFGSPVSESVEARISAMARLRRLASMGAAWKTESRICCSSVASYGAGRLSRTEPMTSPATASGVQRARARGAHRACERAVRWSLVRWGRPERTARHDLGSAAARVSVRDEPGGSLSRFETVGAVVTVQDGGHARDARSRWRRSSSWASFWFSASCKVSENSIWSWPGWTARRMRRIPRTGAAPRRRRRRDRRPR